MFVHLFTQLLQGASKSKQKKIGQFGALSKHPFPEFGAVNSALGKNIDLIDQCLPGKFVRAVIISSSNCDRFVSCVIEIKGYFWSSNAPLLKMLGS